MDFKKPGKKFCRGDLQRHYQRRDVSYFKPDSCVCLAPHHLSHCCQVQCFTHKHIHCRQGTFSHTTYKLTNCKHLSTAHMLTDSSGKVLLLYAGLFRTDSSLHQGKLISAPFPIFTATHSRKFQLRQI